MTLRLSVLFCCLLVISTQLNAGPGPGGQGGTGNQAANDPTGTNPAIETLLPVEPVDAGFWSTHFAGSDNCGSCHNGLQDNYGAGADVSIETDWSTSMMANAARDPFWRAKVASEIQRNPQLEDVINDKCTRCHAPMAHVEASQDSALPTTLQEGFLNPTNPYYDLAMNGVSCTLCHQIDETADLGTEAGFSGQFSIVDLGKNVNRTAFGQYTDPRLNPMLNSSGFQPTWGGHMSDSALCASCHNLKTPFVDAQGNLATTEFPEQMVYSEWENSAFAGTEETCQNCHLPKTQGVKIANRPRFLTARDDFSRHTLLGGNSAMLDILANNKDTLGITATGFDKAIAGTRALLATAASLEMTTSPTNGGIEVVLTVNNESGHKFPTSFPSRRAFIHLEVLNIAGEKVFESGALNPDGSITGVDADSDLTSYEPHYDEITSEDQVQVYEPIMGNTDGNVTYTLLRAAEYLKDNRIPPVGFDKLSVPEDIAVKGDAYSDGNFNNGSDTITYRISGLRSGLPLPSGYYLVRAEIRFQTLAYGFIQDLFRDANSPEVAQFKQFYDDANLRAETIDTTVAIVKVK